MTKPGPPKGTRFAGRQKGTPNKVTASLKEAILAAAEEAGGGSGDGEGLKNYLLTQATSNSNAFMGLLGRVLPMTVSGDKNNPLSHAHTLEVKFVEAPKSEE